MLDCYCDSGWICEAHPDKPFPHDTRAGPGAVSALLSRPECAPLPAGLQSIAGVDDDNPS